MKTSLVAFFITLALITASCGGGEGSDPIIPNSNLSPGAGRANVGITTDNIYAVLKDAVELIFDSNIKANATTNTANQPDEAVRITGDREGYAYATIANADTSVIGVYQVSYFNVNFPTYYSDNGKIYITGNLVLYAEWTSSDVMKKLVVDGSIALSGDYDCTIQFSDLWVVIDSNGEPLDLTGDMPLGMPIVGFVNIYSKTGNFIEFFPYEEVERDGEEDITLLQF